MHFALLCKSITEQRLKCLSTKRAERILKIAHQSRINRLWKSIKRFSLSSNQIQAPHSKWQRMEHNITAHRFDVWQRNSNIFFSFHRFKCRISECWARSIVNRSSWSREQFVGHGRFPFFGWQQRHTTEQFSRHGNCQ